MPALLSEPKGVPADEHEGKTLTKKKSVMGRLKSKISSTLGSGRKKSFVDTSPTDSDLKKQQTSSSTTTSSPAVNLAGGRASEPEASVGQQEEDIMSKHAAQVAEIEPFDAKLVDDDYVDDDDDVDDEEPGRNGGGGGNDEKPPAPAAHDHYQREQEQQYQQQQQDDEEVFAADYKGGADEANDYSEDEDEDDESEEKLEVFHEPSSRDNELDNQHSSRESISQLPQEPEAGPGAMDLVVVGLSPHKLIRPEVAMQSPPLQPSPVKKQALMSPIAKPQPPVTASPREPEAPVAEPAQLDMTAKEQDVPFKPKRRGGIKVDLQQDDGESNNSSTLDRPVLKAAPKFSSRPISQIKKKTERAAAAAVASPEKQQQQPLLSDFHFGSEPASPSASRSSADTTDSSEKRRGAICSALSPSAVVASRKSFKDDSDEANSSSGFSAPMPSPKKKMMTSSSRSLASSAAKTEPRETLQGIKEEDKHSSSSTERPPSPRKVSMSKRRSSAMMMEAPILASAFIAGTDEPASHDDHQRSGEDEIEEEDDNVHIQETTAAGAFAFDTGAAITQEFGERIARLLGADPWGDRQDGFDSIQYVIKKADLATQRNRRELFCAAVAAIQGGVEDRVAPVMYCALECLRTVLKEFAPVVDRSFLKYPPTNEQLSALVKSLTLKLGDSNKRTQRETSQALLRVAKQKKLRTLPHILLHLSAKEISPRLQVDTLRQLVSSLGVGSKNGLSLDVVMQFAIPALKIAEEKTRKAAVELIADLHMLNGQVVNAQLNGIKPEMLRVINRRVDELIAKCEKEQAAAQSTNQAEEATGNGSEGDLEKGAELVAVPVEESKKVIALIEAQLQQAAGVIGPVTWRKLESKTWSDRKEALVDIEKVMTEAKSDLRDAKPAFGSVIQLNFLAYCITVHKCLNDSIAPVVNSAMDCFATLVKVFGPFVEWREESVRDVVLLTIMRLFSTMQKPNSRTNRAACRSILKFARLTNAHTLRYTLSCIFAKETDALVQMHLLRLLVPEFGFQPDGISAALVLSVVGGALVHSNEKVRKTAIDVALYTQRLVGKEYVLKKLKDVKPVTLKELEKNFVDCEMKKDGDRPQTVHSTPNAAATAGDAGLPPVNFGGNDNSRRLLNSAPVGIGKLHCTPQGDDDEFSGGFRRASVLSNEEENFMDSILDGGLD